MGRVVWTALRLLLMSGGVVGCFLLHRYTLASAKRVTVFESVYANCIVTLVLLCYYCVFKFVRGACWRERVRPRNQVMLIPRSPDGSFYNDMQSRPTEVVWGVPRLTLENVWILVYGVGFVLFIGGYCMLGLHPLCLSCFGLAVGVLSVDELVSPRVAHSKLYTSARVGSLLAALVSLGLVTAQLLNQMLVEFVETLDLYALTFGLCLPFLGQFLLVAVRESRHYTLGSVFEVCEFGLPFAVFLSIFHLSVAYGQLFQIDSQGQVPHGREGLATFLAVFRTDRAFVLFYTLAPLLVAPCLLSYVTCALDGSAVDTLISVTLALCVHFLLDGRSSVMGIYGTACCGVALLIRVAAEYSPSVGQGTVWQDRGGGQLGGVLATGKKTHAAGLEDEEG